ncbi:MAG: phosphohistidine phosphatase SixA [Bacteroidales bacterium]
MAQPLSLYLVRHAIAAERGDEYPDDNLRPLTQKGSARFAEAVAGLAGLDVSLDTILTSPLVRARQTADILAKGLRGSVPVTETEALRPGARFEHVVRAVGECGKSEAIALVGHEPGIGELAAKLIGASEPLAFGKGAVCRIEFDQWPPKGPGRLRWFLTQKILRKLGE